MRNSLKRAAAWIFAILMLLTLLPAGLTAEGETTSETQTSDWVIPGLEDGGILANAISAAAVDEADAVTVSFVVGEEAEAAGVVAPESVQVEVGGTLETLPVVAWKDEMGAASQVFAGWYTDKNGTNEFDKAMPIIKDTVLYAKWVAPDEEGRYYVNFYSQDGGTVHLTVSVEEGKPVNPAVAPAMEGKVFCGWSTVLQGETDIAKIDEFNFAQLVNNVVPDNSNTLNLYAWYGDEVKVSFVANGGMAVPTQYIAKGKTAAKPEITRTGYRFLGWSSDPDEYKAFDFATPIEADTTLYAFWEAQLVPVKLVYMHENADDDGYTPAGYSQTVYAPAGSYLSIEKRNITRVGQNHNVRYAETQDGALTGNAYTNGSGTISATIPDVHDTYFQYDSATNNRFVMPDGTTVVLVYYKRVRVTLTFNYSKSRASYDGTMDVNAHVSPEDQTKYNVTYEKRENDQNTGFTYSFTAKYGQRITTVWPQVGWVNTTNNFYGWNKPNSSVQVSNVYTLVSDLFQLNDREIENGVMVANHTLSAAFQDTSTYWLIYARTTLLGETADFTYNNQSYTIYTEACQMAKASKYFSYKVLEGCSAVGTTWGSQYSDLEDGSISSSEWNSKTVSTASGTMQAKFQSVFGTNAINNNDYCQVLLYDRNSLTLNIYVYDDKYENSTQTKSYLYGDWIYNDGDDLLKTVEAEMKKEGYRFAGWYTDPDFTPGTEYTPDADSRITANLDLYAKWEPSQFLAEYYLYIDDAAPYATQGFAEGGSIDDKLVPQAVQSQFLGWYWYQNGSLTRFDFTSAVGQAHVNENGVLKLYAMWDGKTGEVSYLPGIGGNNETQRVDDSVDYEINQAAVRLLPYDQVWEAGTVPNNSSLTFVGWKAPNGAIYQPGRYVLVTRVLMEFEAQWSNDAVQLIYTANGGNGYDVTENWARNSDVAIWDNMDANNPHFTREGYELIGWDEKPNATTPTYLLGVGTIYLDEDVTTLYAIWKRSTVDVTLTKQVVGGPTNKAFGFTVTSTEAIGADSAYNLSSGNKTATFSLSDKGLVTLKNVPIDAMLTVTEDGADDYTTTAACGDKVLDVTDGTDGQKTFELIVPEQNVTIAVTNTIKTGSLKVTKFVTGNMGDRTKAFEFTYSYTLNGEEQKDTFSLANGESNELKNIPYGTEVTITENAYADYKTTYTIGEGAQTEGHEATITIGQDKETVTFTNHKEAIPDTGVLLDSLPYVLILACVIAIGVVAFVRKRRRGEDE